MKLMVLKRFGTGTVWILWRRNTWLENTDPIDIPVIHLRPTSSAYDPVEHAYKSGYESYKMGADLTLTLIRSIFKFKIKPFFLCGFNYIKGYFDALIRKEKLIVSKDLAKFINKKHYSRIIPFKI
ncbi:MAG: hypothetical protein U0V03_00465 [Bacteroidia bacterium]